MEVGVRLKSQKQRKMGIDTLIAECTAYDFKVIPS